MWNYSTNENKNINPGSPLDLLQAAPSSLPMPGGNSTFNQQVNFFNVEINKICSVSQEVTAFMTAAVGVIDVVINVVQLLNQHCASCSLYVSQILISVKISVVLLTFSCFQLLNRDYFKT